MVWYLSPTLWIVVFVAVFLGIGYKLPFIGDLFRSVASMVGGHKKLVWILGICVVLFAFGGMTYLKGAGLNLPSYKGAVVDVSGRQGIGMITDVSGAIGDGNLQNLGCTNAIDTIRERTATIRCTDGQYTGSTNSNMTANLTLTYTRSGSAPLVCDVQVSSPDFKSPSDTSDANIYNILGKDSAGKFYAYVSDGGNGQTVSTSNSQQTGSLSFAEGSGTATLGVALYVDETSTDELNQYDTKPIFVTVDCEGQQTVYTIEYMDLDAAS